MGLAGQSCGTWAANPASAGGVGLFYEQWIAGLLSGVSYADPDHSPLKNLAGGTALNWLENYCRENTPKSLLDAAIAFVRAHRP